jgi:hypothetical protein
MPCLVCRGVKPKIVPSFSWDYRWMDYPGMGKDVRHPYDQSLMTYKGHLVLRTLIRCYFSPLARFVFIDCQIVVSMWKYLECELM